MAEIQIRALSKKFGQTEVLKNLDLTVQDGEFLTLLGSSGCGKSTLLRLIAGLDQPDNGVIRMGDQDLRPLSPSQRDCAMVFQSYALYPHMTVGENISTPLIMRGLNLWQRLPGMRWLYPSLRRKGMEVEASARKVAASLGIEGLWSRKPAQLSGGQRQRVALARAMVRHPAVFLFDEPLSNLDANLRQALRAEIRALHNQLGVTFIYVTHDQHEAMSMSDRVAVMREGQILQLGTPDEIYNRPTHIEVARFVGAPRINLLDGEIHSNGSVWVLGQHLGYAQQASPGVCHIGLRPQIGTRSMADGLIVQGLIDAVEYTGAEFVVTLKSSVSNQLCVFCVHADQQTWVTGAEARIVVPLQEIHVFGADGHRVAFQALPSLRDAA
jgi:multiple sugar transport system ATP-binding protein